MVTLHRFAHDSHVIDVTLHLRDVGSARQPECEVAFFGTLPHGRSGNQKQGNRLIHTTLGRTLVLAVMLAVVATVPCPAQSPNLAEAVTGAQLPPDAFKGWGELAKEFDQAVCEVVIVRTMVLRNQGNSQDREELRVRRRNLNWWVRVDDRLIAIQGPDHEFVCKLVPDAAGKEACVPAELFDRGQAIGHSWFGWINDMRNEFAAPFANELIPYAVIFKSDNFDWKTIPSDPQLADGLVRVEYQYRGGGDWSQYLQRPRPTKPYVALATFNPSQKWRCEELAILKQLSDGTREPYSATRFTYDDMGRIVKRTYFDHTVGIVVTECSFEYQPHAPAPEDFVADTYGFVTVDKKTKGLLSPQALFLLAGVVCIGMAIAIRLRRGRVSRSS